MIKELLWIAPQLESDWSYRPSKLSLKLATSNKTDFENISYKKYKGKKSKILVIFTEQKNMKMKNGLLFSTGNHPVESLLPMLHLKNAGFEFEIVTPTGKPVIFEEWAFPKDDEYVNKIYNEYKSNFKKPGSLQEFVDNSLDNTASYSAVFIPWWHGAMLWIPEDKNVSKVLRWANENDLFTISLCHGPGAFLASTLDNEKFLYEGYNIAVFPDSVDSFTPKIGYLPGYMPFWLSEKLKNLGANIINTKADKTVCLDRNLITGASPLASNELGKLAVKTLLESDN